MPVPAIEDFDFIHGELKKREAARAAPCACQELEDIFGNKSKVWTPACPKHGHLVSNLVLSYPGDDFGALRERLRAVLARHGLRASR